MAVARLFGRPFQIEGKKKPLPANILGRQRLFNSSGPSMTFESGVYFNPVTVGRATLRLSPVSSPRLAWPALAGGRARGLKAWLPAIRAGGRPSFPELPGSEISLPVVCFPSNKQGFQSLQELPAAAGRKLPNPLFADRPAVWPEESPYMAF